mmetsp:Transcript_23771/g.67202  ORF Transcript_23771/g.67202 Transcript_23771/m.67202 type:complete len:349 (-) Transcript_23771:70-1116(-)|eukprot:CAMPEP_0119567630 /NCGR_PEP_ID=MMETSP1352-20130426/36463_1 /TAXON_ID=265584 /ORGANISM="Stauroneis constricta, Strain CCMP1120" /LENGTH=348 /DNA_ID=CAMNT_0007616905 /DNA_START=354 /DNA_END=1400 /DNA_ORIENTATION=-
MLVARTLRMYTRFLTNFMSFVHGKRYDYVYPHAFEKDDIDKAVTVDNVLKFFKKVVEDCGTTRANPRVCMNKYRSAISYFASSKDIPYNENDGTGSPFCSRSVRRFVSAFQVPKKVCATAPPPVPPAPTPATTMTAATGEGQPTIEQTLQSSFDAVHKHIQLLRSEIEQMRKDQEAFQVAVKAKFDAIKNQGQCNSTQIESAPSPAAAAAAPEPAPDHAAVRPPVIEPPITTLMPPLFGPPSTITLCRKPENLFTVWQEFTLGICGSKPAYKFTKSEINLKHIKTRYCQRKPTWDVIRAMIKKGFTAEQAIEKIYEVYGKDIALRTLLNRIVKDTIANTLRPMFRDIK